MRKKNGFISMSIIYSFFTVFILVSTSLLLVYSNNLAIVKTVNREIKEELTTKGNNSLMIFKNLVQDGSFENPTANWTYDTSRGTPIYTEQRYYGNNSLGLIKEDSNATTLVQSSYTIRMIKDHYYYVSRIYLLYNNIEKQNDVVDDPLTKETLIFRLTPSGNAAFTTSNNDFDIMVNAFGVMKKDDCDIHSTDNDCLFENRSINRERVRYDSGFCLKINGRCDNTDTSEGSETAARTSANTFESGIFKFNKNTGNYRILIGSNFSDYGIDKGVPPRYYTDGYMIIDLTVALQLTNTQTKDLFGGADTFSSMRTTAGKIDELLDGRFIENQKTIPVNKIKLD